MTGNVTVGTLRVDFASFGSIDASVRQDVEAALRQAGLTFRYLSVSDAKLGTFLDSTLGKSLGSNPRAIGRAVGGSLTANTTQASRIFTALFGTAEQFRPFTATVLSRADDVSAKQAKFVQGVGGGFGANNVPAVYVERSDDDDSHVKEFKNIPGVSIVDDIDTAAGKSRLVALLTQSGAGRTASAPVPKISANTTSAIVKASDTDSSTTGPLLALVALLGGAAVVVGGMFRRRSSRGA